MATRKQPFPPEPDTQPDLTRRSGRAPKSKRDPLPPTVPPPKVKRGRGSAEHKASGPRSKRPAPKSGRSGATVDEVTADLSRDPRREKE
ncbi:MAG TPA: hypothetical protein VIF09_22605 [Polyangiaceae bacterium]|jgi:hypothetical protein